MMEVTNDSADALLLGRGGRDTRLSGPGLATTVSQDTGQASRFRVVIMFSVL